ncbi:hypothetical protein Tco_1416248 [Tanacetum coccineum]
MDVRRIEEEVDPDFLSDAHSRTGPARTGVLCPPFNALICFFVKIKGALDFGIEVLKVYTKSKKEHESHLKMILELLKKEKCHLKPNKAEAE